MLAYKRIAMKNIVIYYLHANKIIKIMNEDCFVAVEAGNLRSIYDYCFYFPNLLPS